MKTRILTWFCSFLLFWSSLSFSAESERAISLREAIETALAANLDLRLQREDVKAAQGLTLSSRGKFDLTLKAEATANSTEYTQLYPGAAEQEESAGFGAGLSRTLTGGTSISLGWKNSRYESDMQGMTLNPSYGSGLNLEVRQPLLQGFGEEVQTAAIRSSEKQAEAAQQQLDNATANLAAEVKRAYWDLVYNHQDINVQQLSLTLANKLLEETKARINAGKLAPVEIYQPQSEVARREERLISAERAIGVAEDNLKLLLNSEDWFEAFVPTDEPNSDPVTIDLPAVVENTLKNRPDIRAAELRVRAAEFELLQARDSTRPDLALFGGVGFGGTDESYGDALDDSISEPENEWQVGLSFTLPLENSLAEGRLQQVQAGYNKARTSVELLRLQAKREARTTVRDVRLAIKALEATRKTSLATLKRLEAEQAKFASGRATTLDVLTAQEAYARALSQENLTKISYVKSLAELDRIQGLVTYGSHQ
jgi:outer membrane protein